MGMGVAYTAHMSEELQRFWAKVKKTSGCWLWTAALRNKGYGAFCYKQNGRTIQGRAHRFSYEIHKGPIPPGLFVLHKCDTPSCVNPQHLFLGTIQDNVNDMLNKRRHVPGGTHCRDAGKWKRGVAHHGAKITAADVKKLRKMHSTGEWTYSKLGAEFSINGSAAYKVVNRLLWRHVT